MPIDTSIITGMQQPDFSDAIVKGTTLAGLAQQGKIRGLEARKAQQEADDAQAIRNARDNNVTVDKDTGQVSTNQTGMLSDLANSAPHLVPQMQQDLAQQNYALQAGRMDNVAKQHAFVAQLAGGVVDQPSLDHALQVAQSAGIDTKNIPTIYDPKETPQIMGQIKLSSLSAKDQIEAQQKDRDFGIKEKQTEIEGKKLDLELRKNGATQNQETLSALQALRGNPALQRAETNVLSAKNINDLAEQVRDPKTGQINLNNMNPQQISLFNHELLRMASGGTGSEHDLENLKPGTPQYKLATLHQQLTGKVSGADAGPYIQQGLDYANTLGKSSTQFLYQNAKHVVDAKRNYLAPQDQQKYDAWLNEVKSGKAAFGDVTGDPSQAPAPVVNVPVIHPQLQGKSLSELKAMKANMLNANK